MNIFYIIEPLIFQLCIVDSAYIFQYMKMGPPPNNCLFMESKYIIKYDST